MHSRYAVSTVRGKVAAPRPVPRFRAARVGTLPRTVPGAGAQRSGQAVPSHVSMTAATTRATLAGSRGRPEKSET